MVSHHIENALTRWAMGIGLVLTGFLIGGGVVTGIYRHIYTPAPMDNPEASVLGVPDPVPPAPPVRPDPVTAAKQVKPLAEIRRDDRVIYRGALCHWRAWRGDLSTSVIKCPGTSQFPTRTVLLTPVEIKH